MVPPASTARDWEALSARVTTEDLLTMYRKPSRFQTALADFLQSLPLPPPPVETLEVGSAFGVTSALLAPDRFRKTLLDFAPAVLEKARVFFDRIAQEVRTVQADARDLRGLTSRYDLVFSAGLIEHFDVEERRRIVGEIARVARPGATLVLAVPNHDSPPYRTAYRIRKRQGRWPYPDEFALGTAAEETRGIRDIVVVRELSLDRRTACDWLPRGLSPIFRIAGWLMRWPGYLRVIVLQKTAGPEPGVGS